VHRAPPAARRLVGLGQPLLEGRLLVWADCGDAGAGGFRHPFAAGVSRNHLQRHSELPLPGVRKPANCFPGRVQFQSVPCGDSCPQALIRQRQPSAHFSLALRCSVSGYSRFKVTARSRVCSVPVIPGWFVKVRICEQYSIGHIRYRSSHLVGLLKHR
jgi:hypothetical protein